MIVQGSRDCIFVPLLRVEIEIFHLPVLEKTCEADSVVCEMRFFANDHNVIFSALRIELEQLLAGRVLSINITRAIGILT